MKRFGRFGPLLGTIHIGNVTSKFLIYAARNAEILTCHEVPLRSISTKPGWLEYEPLNLWKSVVECIEIATKNLVFLDIDPTDIVAVGLTNQRETTVLWDAHSGEPLYNAIAWNDVRTAETVRVTLSKIRNNKNYLREVCGLPISTCFSAIKVKWIMDNVDNVRQKINENKCLFGTLDTWILWNLTGGIEGGIHVTDITNASRTMLMNLRTLKWDNKLCAFFRINPGILPTIKTCSEVYGFIHEGPLSGIPLAGCLGDQQAALLGQMCMTAGQATCTYDEGSFLLVNTGQEIIDSENGLLSTVGFQLGPKSKPFYALEGAVANAGSAISWLKNSLMIETEINHSSQLTQSFVSIESPNISQNGGSLTPPFGGNGMTSSGNGSNSTINTLPIKTDLIFIPAFHGLQSPFWKPDTRGILMGLSSHTTPQQVTQAAYEATCYQTRELLEALKKDCKTWKPLQKLIVGGEFTENKFLLQLMADLCGIELERPQTSSPACLGVMLAAGYAMELINLENAQLMFAPPSDVFQPTMPVNHRDIKYKKWKYAIKKCLNWDPTMTTDYDFDDADNDEDGYGAGIDSSKSILKFDDDDQKDPFLAVRNSIPGSLFMTSAFALLIIAKIMLENQSMIT